MSIVTPSLNQAKYIEHTIKSVLAQDYPNIEHIIVDGGSTDGTVKILKKYKHLRWISEKDNGQSDAINKGARMAKGKFIGWLNSDDLYYPHAVSTSIKALRAHPEAAMAYSDCDLIDGNGRVIDRMISRNYNEYLHLLWRNAIPQPTAFMRRNSFMKAGMLDTSMHYCMDWELWIRLGRVGKLIRINGCLAAFRLIRGTKTYSNTEGFKKEITAVCDRYGVPAIFWALRQDVKKMLFDNDLLHKYNGILKFASSIFPV